MAWIEDTPGISVDEILGESAIGGPTEWGSHRWNDLLRCPRYYYFRYGLRMVPEGPKSEALEFGTIIHECLARRYRGQDPWAILELLDERGYEGEALDDATRGLEAYEDKYGRWDGKDKEADPYFSTRKTWIERELLAASKSGVKLTARADLIYPKRRGLVVVDHKTSKRMSGKLTGGFTLDTQILTLMLAATRDRKLRDSLLFGVEINAIVRTRDVQLRRIFYAYDSDLVSRFRTQWFRWVKFRVWAEENDWPMFTSACTGKFDIPCIYRDACLHHTFEGFREAGPEEAL